MSDRVVQDSRSPVVILITTVGVLALLALWEGQPNESYLALKLGRPSEIASYLTSSSSIYQVSAISVARALLALVMTALLSALAFSLSVLFPSVVRPLTTLLVFLQALPFTVIVLLAVVASFSAASVMPSTALGDTFVTVAAVTAVTVLQPLASSITALDAIRKEVRCTLDLWQVSPFTRLWRVYLFEVLPYWLVSMRVTAAWVTGSVLVAESMIPYNPESPNLGRLLWQVIGQAGRADKRGATIVVACFAGLFVYATVSITTHQIQKRTFGTQQ